MDDYTCHIYPRSFRLFVDVWASSASKDNRRTCRLCPAFVWGYEREAQCQMPAKPIVFMVNQYIPSRGYNAGAHPVLDLPPRPRGLFTLILPHCTLSLYLFLTLLGKVSARLADLLIHSRAALTILILCLWHPYLFSHQE